MWVVNSCSQEPLSLYVWHTDVLGTAAAASSKLAVLVASVAAGVQLVAFYCSAQHALCVGSCRLPNKIDHTQRVCPGVLVCVCFVLTCSMLACLRCVRVIVITCHNICYSCECAVHVERRAQTPDICRYLASLAVYSAS